MAEIRTIRTNQLKPGMTVSGDIANEQGVVVLYNDFILDEKAIQKLSGQGIEFVRIVLRDGEVLDLGEPVIKPVAESSPRVISTAERQSDIQQQYMTGISNLKSVIYGISMGKTVELHHVHEITKIISTSFSTIGDAISCLNQVRNIDEYTYAHSMNVATLCSLLGGWLNLPPLQIKQLTYCGLLHDIGKSKISTDILLKPGKLSPKEVEEIRMHPVYGYKVLEKSTTINPEIAKGVLLHHEREDGSGYPFGLTGEKIPLFAKIVGIVDTFDAMTANRSFQNRATPFDVMDMFRSEYLTKCDPGIMMTFMRHISAYYIGQHVRLSTGETAEIIYINPIFISKPILKTASDVIIDLSSAQNIKIAEML